MSITKFYTKKFDENINFGLWKLKLKAILIQNALQKTLEGILKRLASIVEDKWEKMDLKSLSNIKLYLSNKF